MLIREDAVSTVAVSITCAFAVEVESLARTYHGTAFSEFIDLLPYATVQRQAVREAKQWIKHMTTQGLDLIGNETDIRLWGPYRPKSALYKRALGADDAATSYRRDEDPFPDGMAKMLLTGRFLARQVEHG